MRRGVAALLVLTAVACAATLGGLAWWRRALSPAGLPDAPARVFVVERGDSLAAVVHGLEDEGLVRSARALSWWARLRGWEGRLRAGEYELSPALPATGVLEEIARGRVRTYELVVPEGWRARDIAERLEKRGLARADAFLSVVNDPQLAAELGVEGDDLEGYLFPETYRLSRGLPAREIARAMVEQFHGAWRQIAPAAHRSDLSMREVVILASIVEKETGAPEERPLIAAVFLNRLERGMRLQTDPSVIYGIQDFDGNITRDHLEDADNPYNTYRHGGLPPGPIASPGLDALRAVVEPADSDYLYFVSMGDGTHAFSRTYREHVKAVNRYQRRRAAR